MAKTKIHIPWVLNNITPEQGEGEYQGFLILPFTLIDDNFREIQEKINVNFNLRVLTQSGGISATDSVVFCNPTSDITVTLPPANQVADYGECKIIQICNLSNFQVTVSEVTGGAVLLAKESGTFISDGSQWYWFERALNADTLDGYHASTTPGANKIPVADSNGKLNSWVTFPDNADTLDGYHASQTPSANTIPVSKSDGYLDPDWLPRGTGGFARVVDLTNATEDYLLVPGEVAMINADNATSKALRIVTTDGSAYQMWIIPYNRGSQEGATASEVFLRPNNTTYSNAFVYARLYRNGSGLGDSYTTVSAFKVGLAYTQTYCYLVNYTVYKGLVGYSNSYGITNSYPWLTCFAANWRDTTTPWTSLGTIVFPQATSARILVIRVR